jgi:hypothetical protein
MHIPSTAACSAGLPQAPVPCSVLHYLLSESLGFDFSRPTRPAIHCPGFDAVPKQSLCHLINARTGRESKLKVSKLPTCERDLGSVLRKTRDLEFGSRHEMASDKVRGWIGLQEQQLPAPRLPWSRVLKRSGFAMRDRCICIDAVNNRTIMRIF